MKNRTRKKTTILIITLLFTLLTLAYMGFMAWALFINRGTPILVKIILVVILIGQTYVCYSLIRNMFAGFKEIDTGETDDLDRY